MRAREEGRTKGVRILGVNRIASERGGGLLGGGSSCAEDLLLEHFGKVDEVSERAELFGVEKGDGDARL